ncbi:glutamine amidotransferase [Mycobacterium sp. MS1601]|uniref:type 1 glutamine amidotransferase n=1 Tax=Mycobacterium sp. MS1601 TaxID=1936029 RepID=UPI000979492F|nr:type 1 glutamine amidotransferase [Mycobacterium sp. MS1601]AQA04867.1 glutamine amidotransferase [Mycobacterium sp. MS1601]
MARSVLFIYNDPNAPEALLGEVFTEQGFDVDTLNVVPLDRAHDPASVTVEFPDPTSYDVIVPLGSRWSVYNEELRAGWVGAQETLVRSAVDAGVGVLGVCFGGQLVAQALGGSVRKAAVGELGWYEISTDTTDLIPEGPWFEWHSDQFTAPPGATELARTARASQAFVYRTALGLQFHPELDLPLLDLWLADEKGDSSDIARMGVDIEALRARTVAEQDGAGQRLRRLVTGFLDRVSRVPVGEPTHQ